MSAFEKYICLPASEPDWYHIALFNKTSAICLPERIASGDKTPAHINTNCEFSLVNSFAVPFRRI